MTDASLVCEQITTNATNFMPSMGWNYSIPAHKLGGHVWITNLHVSRYERVFKTVSLYMFL